MKRKRMKRLRSIEIEVQNVEIVKKRRGEIKENERERDEAYDQAQRRKNELFVENKNQKILIHKKRGKNYYSKWRDDRNKEWCLSTDDFDAEKYHLRYRRRERKIQL